jgi:hypothetical protein
MSVSLLTNLATDECLRRITAAIDRERLTLFSFSGFGGSKPILGRVGKNTFRLRKRRFYRNSFAPFFYGQVSPFNSGSLIEGHFGMHPFVKVFMGIWFSGVILIGGSISLRTVIEIIRNGYGGKENQWLGVGIFPIMLTFGVLLIASGKWLGKSEEANILKFLQETLQAEKHKQVS